MNIAPPASREELAAAVRGFERVALDRPELKPASVAICVVMNGPVASLVLTRRTARLRSHSGQWALPGGRRDLGESVIEAALRETEEEIGLTLAPADVVVELDDYATRTGYLMTPVVLWGGLAAPERTTNAEVASIHYVPLVDLGVEPILVPIAESPNPVIRLPLFDRYVHAPTGAIIHQFCELVLYRRITRVAHFEAPVQMWSR